MKRLIIFCCLMTILLTACSGSGKTSPIPTPVKDASQPAQVVPGGINANGILLPARQVDLSFGASGKVETILVNVGENVQKEQELARLGSTLTVKGQTAAALQEIADASKILDEARLHLYYFSMPTSLSGLDTVSALKKANDDLIQARAEYESCKDASRQRGDCRDNKKDSENGQNSGEDAEAIKEAGNKKRQLDNAQDAYNAVLRRIEYEAALLSAEARLAKAEEEYKKLLAGSQEGSAFTEQMIINAPFDGVVAVIHVNENEWADTGVAVIELQDVSRWRIETKNVSELQIGRVAIGQEVRATVNAFRGETVNGRVIEIHPDAVVQQGDVTYTLIIELDATDLNLRPGMTVQLVIMAE